MFSQEEGERVGLDDDEEEEDVFEGGVPPMPQADIQVLYHRHLLKISFQDLQTGLTRFTKGSPWKSP